MRVFPLFELVKHPHFQEQTNYIIKTVFFRMVRFEIKWCVCYFVGGGKNLLGAHDCIYKDQINPSFISRPIIIFTLNFIHFASSQILAFIFFIIYQLFFQILFQTKQIISWKTTYWWILMWTFFRKVVTLPWNRLTLLFVRDLRN